MQWRYWSASLKRLGIRNRESYQTRHTFATLVLMARSTPVWIARWIARHMGNSAPCSQLAQSRLTAQTREWSARKWMLLHPYRPTSS